jgi:23S rRNA A2030 N6-methylase RlmJ
MRMSPLSYDHHKKAGNQGDICKHVALVAALDETISRAARNPFRFADLYAGYAKNPLLEGHEWPNGIGKIAGANIFGGNRHVQLWAAISDLNQAPRLGGGYPGSAWFAMQVCMRWNRAFELSLWDVGPAPFGDLQTVFSNGNNIFNRAAVPNEPSVASADFVFIDPPDKKKLTWANIREHVGHLESEQDVLIWLPIAANTTQKPPVEDEMSGRCRSDFFVFAAPVRRRDELRSRIGATTIRWAKGGHTIGCQLLYRLNSNAQMALRAAVEEIVSIAKWPHEPKHYTP